MKRIVIIGGGISGLAAAHHLNELDKTNQQITLIEASGRLGGTIQTEHREGFLLERGPDSFISEKPYALALAKRLGLESRLIQTNEKYRRSFIVRNGRLRPVPEGFQLLAPARIWPLQTSWAAPRASSICWTAHEQARSRARPISPIRRGRAIYYRRDDLNRLATMSRRPPHSIAFIGPALGGPAGSRSSPQPPRPPA